jgi:uncharacterized protein DUF2380
MASIMKSRAAGLVVTLLLLPLAGGAPAPVPVKIAVFNFELDDQSPSAVLLSQSPSRAATLEKATEEARRELTQSGRYQVVDASKVDTHAVPGKALRNCGGCEAALALQLGAEQALIGVITSATQTDYYVTIEIRDAHSGKILDEQEANFAGSEEGWPSGVRMLIKHQILVPQE